ncbi:uncharacterized protein ColSpa_07172 [Colletotrichum spaethianum]|uniref:Uncharacterized protein n=1 Tax=Colletotrichum spaethianum TaxID=700344 RepID=A0AA37LE54_9PEZI|nr:uncharacterized protein ColSpa_07172 [Colletotrichum spaethianum]GKT46991.1 hypothetical protein ColSpa_07172 [Colletotrichum spaethianum]
MSRHRYYSMASLLRGSTAAAAGELRDAVAAGTQTQAMGIARDRPPKTVVVAGRFPEAPGA